MASDEVFQAEPAAPKSSGSKIWLFLGLGCGVMVLLCCGVFGGLGWFGYSVAKNTLLVDPTRVAALGEDIASMDVPERFTPGVAVDLTAAVGAFSALGAELSDGNPTRAVWYVNNQNGGGVLMLFEVKGGTAAAAEQSQQVFNNTAQGQNPVAATPAAAQVVNTETHARTIGGEPAEFTIREYRDENAGKTYWQAQGAFRNKTGWVYLLLIENSDGVTKDDILEIIDSIQ